MFLFDNFIICIKTLYCIIAYLLNTIKLNTINYTIKQMWKSRYLVSIYTITNECSFSVVTLMFKQKFVINDPHHRMITFQYIEMPIFSTLL